MAVRLNISEADLVRLYGRPGEVIEGTTGGIAYRASVAIANYADKLASHYDIDVHDRPVPFEFMHFGLVCEFESATEVLLYNGDRVLDEGVRAMVARYGPLMLRNAHLPEDQRINGQRNIFPNLSFHLDRGNTQADRYSLFCRDPFDEAQRQPRTSSTLILANLAAYLQAQEEGQDADEVKSRYTLFEEQELGGILGNIVLEQAWQAPVGTGELCLIDNRTVLHASYYQRPEDKGYPIGVRYLY